MIPEPGDANREITVTETSHLQTDDELSDKELKQIEADDQAIQTILLGLPEDIYAAVDSYETAQEIWLRVQQMMKGSGIGIQEKKANQNEVDMLLLFIRPRTCTQLITLNYQSSFNQNYLQQPMPNPEDITDPTTAMNMALALMAKEFKLNYSTPTNNNQRISSNPRNRQIAQPGMNMGQDRQIQMVGGNSGNQFRQYAGNPAGYNDVIGNQGNTAGQNGNQIRCYNCRGVGHYARNCTVRPRRRDDAYLQTQLLIARREEAGIQLQAEEYDIMATAADLDEIKEVNANCILMANLQQASTLGTQTDSAPFFDSDRSAEVHEICDENCNENEIFNMFTQEEQYTELLEPILESHQVPQNDNDVISENTSVEQGGETVEQHPIFKLNKQLSKEKSTVSFLLEEKKKLKSDFKICEDDLLDKLNQLEKKIKELNNILLKTGQSIQTIHMLSPKPDSFYHTEQKMALGYQNPFYLKQAQKKQQSLYDGKVLLEKHDPPVVHDSEETLQLAQEKELYTELLETIPESHQVPQNDNDVISEDTSVEQGGKTVEQHPGNFEETRALYESLYQNLAIKVEKVNSVNRKLKETNADLTTELARFKNQERCFEISQEKYDKLERCYQQSVYQEQCLSKKINALHLSTDFKSLANEADASLAKHKALQLEIERLLKAVVGQDIMIIVQNELQSNIYKNAELKTQLFKKVSDQKDNTQDTSKNTKFAKQPIVENLPKIGKTNALSKPVTSNSVSTPQESKSVNNDKVIAPEMFRINPSKTSREEKRVPNTVIQIYLWCVDLGCSKHMTRNLKLLINFVWKFMGTVRLGNDHVAAILGFGDLQWGNILITRVYFIEGLGHNLFSVGQFCDSDLEVAFRRDACFVRNLEGVDLLKGDRSTNLHTINLHEMASASPICLMACASSTKSWLWHQRLLKFRYHKEHLCPSCEQGKSKRASHPPKPVPNSKQRLHLLHMDLCGPMRIASINGKRYVLVIVDDYSRYTWVHFLRSKDEALEVIIKFLKRITVLLQSLVIIIRTDNGTEFKNQVLKEYFDTVSISHQMSSVRTPQQNRVVERRNRTLVEAARTMLFFLVHRYSYGLRRLLLHV
nr:retrovirus-related Pol polyprotein from transposon TNT 1-94 [Tanacetum cinerariifolium]